MIELKGLNQKPETLEENPTPELLREVPTYRRLFKMIIGNSLAKDKSEESVDMVQIAMKLKIDDDSIPLEDAQFKLLREKVIDNYPKLTGMYQGQLLMLLDKCKDDSKKDKK